MTKISNDKKRHATSRQFTYARYNSPHQLYHPENPSTWFGSGRASRGEELTTEQLDQEWAEHIKAKVRYLLKARGGAAQTRNRMQTRTERRS
jgi:hypothetical protein